MENKVKRELPDDLMKKMNLKKNTFYKMVKKYESNIDKSCKKWYCNYAISKEIRNINKRFRKAGNE